MKKLFTGSITQTMLLLVGITFMGALSSGCSSMSLTRQDVVRQYDAVAQLSDGLVDARGQDGALLAPITYSETKSDLDEAILYARKADKARANEVAQQGLKKLQKLNKMIVANRIEMDEVVNIRTRANLQGANLLFKEGSKEADNSFRAASRLLEKGETESARKLRPELIQFYARLELDALKQGTVAVAEKAIAAAEEADADKYAPKTLQNAREELKLSLSVLDADRTRADESNSHAQTATWMANQAREITALLKYYKSQDFTNEDRLLWYQNQLQQVRNALRDETLPFNQPNTKVIQELRDDELALKSVMKDIRLTNQLSQQRTVQLEQNIESQRQMHEKELQNVLKIHENQLAALSSGNASQMSQAKKEAAAQVATLKKRLSDQSLAQAKSERLSLRSEERFTQTQNRFSTEEAGVFRQGDNVLIRLNGFNFKPGKFEVDAVNYALLNKVVAAINTFPGSSVTVIGHTDEVGSDQHNLDLSAARARSVVGFLSTVGGIDANRLTADGRGEEEPVASNETEEGRGANRRIDVLIVNTETLLGSVPTR
ncbi:OmpA family protein [bacterium]|nr:OmpA family protein [bacterium]